MSGSDFADWWNDKVVKNQPTVIKWIRENPGLASIVFTPAVPSTLSTLDGFVEVARIGEGFGAALSDEATAADMVKGIGSDALRALSVIPFTRAPGMAIKIGLRQVTARSVPFFKQVSGGLCSEIASVQAVRHAGQKLFLKLDDILLKTRGKTLDEMTDEVREKGMDFITLSLKLEELGVKLSARTSPKSFDEIARSLTGTDTMIFGVKWQRRFPDGKVAEDTHTLYAFLDHARRFRIRDRTGRIVASMEELGRLEPGYGGIENAVIHPTSGMVKIHGLAIVELIEKVGFGVLMLPLLPHVVVNADQATPEMVAQSVEAKIQRDEQKKVPATVPAGPVKASTAKPLKPAVPRIEWLTGVKFRLNHLGYGAGPPIHLYDDRCKQAIRQFQKDYNLQVDGIPGPQTQAKLKAVCKY